MGYLPVGLDEDRFLLGVKEAVSLSPASTWPGLVMILLRRRTVSLFTSTNRASCSSFSVVSGLTVSNPEPHYIRTVPRRVLISRRRLIIQAISALVAR